MTSCATRESFPLVAVEALPPEMLLQVFSHLTDDVVDLLRLPLVCRAWNCLARDEGLWKEAYLKHCLYDDVTQLPPPKQDMAKNEEEEEEDEIVVVEDDSSEEEEDSDDDEEENDGQVEREGHMPSRWRRLARRAEQAATVASKPWKNKRGSRGKRKLGAPHPNNDNINYDDEQMMTTSPKEKLKEKVVDEEVEQGGSGPIPRRKRSKTGCKGGCYIPPRPSASSVTKGPPKLRLYGGGYYGRFGQVETSYREKVLTGLRVKELSFLVLSSSRCEKADLHIPFQVKRLEVMDSSTSTPSLEQLSRFDAILVIGGSSMADNRTLSNNVAAYVKRDRGGVVVARAANQNGGSYCLRGTFLQEKLHPLVPGSMNPRFEDTRLGKRLKPDHPILHGVSEFGSCSRCAGRLEEGATLVAEWMDGIPLIAEMRKKEEYGMVVTVNAGCEVAPVGGSLVLANALAYAALHSAGQHRATLMMKKMEGVASNASSSGCAAISS